MLAHRLIGLARSPGGGIADPTEVSGLLRWYEGDVLGLADGTAVSSWTDQSANADHAVQADSAKQPVLKTGVASGHDAVRFDGSNDWLTFAEILDSSAATAHIFVVSDSNATGARVIMSTRQSDGQSGWSLRYNPQTTMQYFHAGGGATPIVSYSITDQLNIIEVQRNGLDVTLGANGALGTETAISTYVVSSADRTIIGAENDGTASFLNGDIAEIVIYDHVLSAGDRTSVLDYLTAKY